MTQFIVIDTV